MKPLFLRLAALALCALLSLVPPRPPAPETPAVPRLRQWPSSFVASMLHFELKDYLKVDEEQKKSYPNLDEAFKK